MSNNSFIGGWLKFGATNIAKMKIMIS